MGESWKGWAKAAAVGTSMAMTLALLVLGGNFLGQYLDSRWHTKPLFQLVLILGGVVFGGVYIVVAVKQLGTKNNEN